MHHLIILAAAVASQQQSPIVDTPEETVVVTASREPVPAGEAGVSATIFDEESIDALAFPMASDLLRLSPGVAIAASGPRGALAEVRIRGAEAKHSLLFIDGIRFNDPAVSNARFDLLTSDGLSRIEIVRGPQSALWGSEALGGVIAVETADGFDRSGISALGEYGSNDSRRASLEFARSRGDVGFSGSAGRQSSDGIDIFSEQGERDGFDNSTVRIKAVYRPSSTTEAGLVGHYVSGENQYDNFVNGQLADTLDTTENRIFGARGWLNHQSGPWSLLVDLSYLDSANRNLLDGVSQDARFGDRLAVGAQLSRTNNFGSSTHRFTVATEFEVENFRGRDTIYSGATNQDRRRELAALIGQWHASWGERLTTDVAVRHDWFSAFADATTARATVAFRPSETWLLHASYGEGISQPTFYDLFGFFPGQGFRGNPGLRPESSRGWEAGVRWSNSSASVGVTGFSHDLVDENLLVFDATGSTTVNADGESRRRGLEFDMAYRPVDAVFIHANYTLLDADEQRRAGGRLIKEARRPRHSANLIGIASLGPFEVGASIAYVGKRREAVFPTDVTLDDYLLGSLRVGYRLTPTLEAYARVENAFDADYQDAFGYNTPGRAAYAGLRLRLDP